MVTKHDAVALADAAATFAGYNATAHLGPKIAEKAMCAASRLIQVQDQLGIQLMTRDWLLLRIQNLALITGPVTVTVDSRSHRTA